MMDLPLASMTAPPLSLGGALPGGHRQDPEGFAATLTSLLGEAGHEVVDMVEALEALADLQGAERAELAGVGWPLPAFLALAEGQTAGPTVELGDQAADEVDALLGQLLDAVEPALDGAVDGGPGALGELLQGEGDPASVDGGAGLDGEEIEQALAAALAASQTPGTGRAGDGERAGEPDTVGRVRDPATADTVKPDAAERATRRTTESARTTGAGEAARVPGSVTTAVTADAAGAEAAAEPSAALSGMEASRRATAERHVGVPTAIQRIMEAVERLENQPPPRQLTLELGDIRLRVSMEDGHVRLSLLDGDRDAGDELLRDAEQELAQHGFDLGDDTGGSSDADPWPGEHAGPARPPGATHRRSADDPAGALHL